MPNQSDSTQTDPVQTSVVPPVEDNPPVVAPDFQMAGTPDIPAIPTMPNEDSQPIASTQTSIPVDDGSAAPIDDTSGMMVSTPPKKKFGGGKIIATILGLLLLVGGIAGGVILTQQNQQISEKADVGSCSSFGTPTQCESSCSPVKSNGQQFQCKWLSNQGCIESAQECSTSGGGWGGNSGGCSQYHAKFSENNRCLESTTADPISPTKYKCPGYFGGGGCQQNGQVITAQKVCFDDNFCGTQQIDLNYPNCWISVQEGAGQCLPPPDNTPPPPPTAQCTDVRAYTENFVQLSATQLSQLKAGNKVNFCVKGNTSLGNFDKAKFTINNVAQPETTTPRPGSTNEFCQLYTIPPAPPTTFNITAQIHHVTLGWKGP